MTPHRTRGTGRTALTATACAVLLSGCSDDGGASSVPSRAASAVQSVGSRAGDAFASATASAGEKLNDIKGGVDATDDVKLGTPSTSDDRTTVQVTVTNSAGSTKSFAVQVDFKDSKGDWKDTVVVTVPDVPAGKQKTATARSTHRLPSGTRATVPRAVRY
ncbi:hypothetical protein ACH4F6_22350 [Streptomyces sp. NPDC017936]|uniref:hypothetical protein n=1 Tax=Streptomyces sp. NPDC017936 TaxID=3365016 RepID=UPI0037BC401A